MMKSREIDRCKRLKYSPEYISAVLRTCKFIEFKRAMMKYIILTKRKRKFKKFRGTDLNGFYEHWYEHTYFKKKDILHYIDTENLKQLQRIRLSKLINTRSILFIISIKKYIDKLHGSYEKKIEKYLKNQSNFYNNTYIKVSDFGNID